MGRSGASLGVVNFSPVDYWPLNTALYVTDFHGNDRRFAYYFLKQFDFRSYNSGSAQPSLNRNFIHPILADVPPVCEQRAIAHVLGTLDDKIDSNRRTNRTLEKMARALFKSWFVDFDPVHAKTTLKHKHHAAIPSQGGSGWSVERARAYLERMDPDIAALFPDRFVDSELGPIPEGWEVKRLGDLCNKPEYGYTASAKNEPVGPKFLRITDINKKSWLEWESVPYCQISGVDFGKYRLNEGDIPIVRMADPGHGWHDRGETAGRLCLLSDSLPPCAQALRPPSPILATLGWLLGSRERKGLGDNSSGTGWRQPMPVGPVRAAAYPDGRLGALPAQEVGGGPGALGVKRSRGSVARTRSSKAASPGADQGES